MKTERLNPRPEGLRRVAAALAAGEVCALPTETVYGLAGLAHSSEALARIFAAKERPHFDPLIVHVPSEWSTLAALDAGRVTDSSRLSPDARAQAEILMRAFWPGPLTLILPKHPDLPDLATSGLSTVGVRMPAHPIFQAVLTAVGQPLAAPSANRFGRISPTLAKHAASELDGRIPFVLDGGPCEVGLESTIVALPAVGASSQLTILRPGRIGAADLAGALGIDESRISRAAPPSATPNAPQAPGMLESHYAPRKRLILLPTAWEEMNLAPLVPEIGTKPWALLHWGELPSEFAPLFPPKVARSLSRTADAEEAARNLFGALRALDESAAEILVAAAPPVTHPELALTSLLPAIQDRLTRAASRGLVDPAAEGARAAILEGWKFAGATAPNPPVGAAALDAQGRVIGVAAHARAGTAHAEAKLLEELRARGLLAKAHTLFVTLEPCNHQGRTGPCTQAILGVPSIRQVFFAETDPNPAVAGQGAALLLSRGIDCRSWTELGIEPPLLRAARELNAPFRKWVTTGIPWVVVKSAQRPDGSMIPPKGARTFTSPASLLLAHRLRRESDAILTGSGTILADDPKFTVRRLPDHALDLRAAKPRRLFIPARRARVPAAYLEAAEGRDFVVERASGSASLAETLQKLGKSGVLQVLVEAGPALRDAILQEGLWDRHVIITACPPKAATRGRLGELCNEGIDRVQDVHRNH